MSHKIYCEKTQHDIEKIVDIGCVITIIIILIFTTSERKIYFKVIIYQSWSYILSNYGKNYDKQMVLK